MNRLRIIGEEILGRHGFFFSIDQVTKATGISRKYCRDVLSLLCQEGLIRQIKKRPKEHTPGRSLTYSMVYCVADRKKLTDRMAPRQLKNTIEDRLWFIIWNKFRNDGSFNLRDLIVLGDAKRETARSYLKALRRAGYVAPTANSGGPGTEWQLTGRFGPERPCLDRSRRIKRGTKSRPN